MTYYDIATLQQDADFQQRTSACYATETRDQNVDHDPGTWTAMHAWDMASMPGFGDAYASAIAGGVPNPGRDPAVITDPQILAAVQLILDAEAPGNAAPKEGD